MIFFSIYLSIEGVFFSVLKDAYFFYSTKKNKISKEAGYKSYIIKRYSNYLASRSIK